jgi:hypothetical protein
MGKPIVKLLGILILVLVAFILGANQHRTRGWPFGQGYFQGFSNYSYTVRSRKIAAWVENLKKGGYILFFRHAHRDKWAEVEAFDFYEFASHTEDASQTSFKKAVCLSEEGVEEAKMIGITFQLAKIPTGVIVSSPSCRARQTAIFAFGRYDLVDKSIRFAGLLGEKPLKGSADELLTLLRNVKIEPGTNTIIAGHGTNLGPNGVGGVEGDFPGGNSPPLLETGFYVIERGSGGKLRLVFSFKSISELATHAINVPQQ